MKPILRSLVPFAILLSISSITQATKFITKGSTSQSISVVICDVNDDPNVAGVTIANLDLYCLRDGHQMSAKTDLVALASDHAAWTSGRAYHQGQGLYRIDIPDANLSDGNGVTLTYAIVDAVSHNRTAYYEVQLNPPIDVNTIYGDPVPSSADLRAQIRYQLAATVTPADCNVNSMALSAWELSHAIIAQPGTTIAVVTDASTFTLTAGSTADDWYNQALIVVEDVSDSNRRCCRFVRNYTGVSKTVETDEAFPFLPAAGDTVYIYSNRAVGRGRVSP